MYFVKQQDHVRGEDTDSGVKETYIQVLALPFSARDLGNVAKPV